MTASPGFRLWIFGSVRGPLAAIVLAASLCGCDQEPPAQATAPPPRPVEIAQVTSGDLPVEYEFVGRTESSQRVEIRARVDGFLDEIAYEEGEFVDAGDTLFRIDGSPFESRLRRARAEEAQQQARLENAEALLARVEPLAEAEAVSEKELDDARGRVREAAAAVEAAAANVYDAELNLGYTTITSPVRGLTGSANEREGAYISGVSNALTYVARIHPIWVEFSITETQILRGERASSEGVVVHPENGEFEVFLELADGRVHPYSGRISFADASVSTRTGAVQFRASVPNPEEELRPGQYVRIFVRGAYRADAITVPQRSVLQGPKGAFVWVVNAENQAEQRPVTLGPWEGDRWVVETGLRVGDRVVVNGTVGLKPGAPLTITRILEAGGLVPASPAGSQP